MTTSTRRLPSGDTITYDSEDGSRVWRRKDGTTWRSVHYGPWQRVDEPPLPEDTQGSLFGGVA